MTQPWLISCLEQAEKEWWRGLDKAKGTKRSAFQSACALNELDKILSLREEVDYGSNLHKHYKIKICLQGCKLKAKRMNFHPLNNLHINE